MGSSLRVPEIRWPKGCHAWRITESRLPAAASHDWHCIRQGQCVLTTQCCAVAVLAACCCATVQDSSLGRHDVRFRVLHPVLACRRSVGSNALHSRQQNLSPGPHHSRLCWSNPAEGQTSCTLSRRWAHHHGRIVTHDLKIAVWTAGTSKEVRCAAEGGSAEQRCPCMEEARHGHQTRSMPRWAQLAAT